MYQTDCYINGHKCKLKFQKGSSAKGKLYKGILFSKPTLGFSYLLLKDNIFEFEPSFVDRDRRDAIIKAISERIQKENSDRND